MTSYAIDDVKGPLVRMTVAVVRVVLILWGASLVTMSVLELLEPGFLRSERSLFAEVGRLEVFPGVLSMAAIGTIGIIPSRWLSSQGRRRFAYGVALVATIGLAFAGPGTVGLTLHWTTIPHALVAYALPAVVAILLAQYRFPLQAPAPPPPNTGSPASP